MLDIIKELDDNRELQDIFGRPVSGALTVIAEKGDLLIEEGGAVTLSEEQKSRFLEILGRIAKHAGHRAHTRSEDERIRVRCDVLAAIIHELDRNGELRAIFGGAASEALVVIAEGEDLRIEVKESIRLTEGQSSVFLGILNQIVEKKTAIDENPAG